MFLREIEVFRSVMLAGTTSKAAALLGISQPAVSQAIRRLENLAEFALFQRLRGRLHPTPEAQALLVEVDRAFIGLSNIEHRLRSLRRFGVNTLTVACYPALGLGFVPRALARLASERPDPATRPQVSLQILSSKEVRDRVQSAQADFGLMADELPTEGLEHSAFANLNGVVVMHPSHRLALQKVVRPEHLVDEPFLALNPEDATRSKLEQAIKHQNIRLSVSIESPFSASICEMAVHGLGVGLVNPITALDYAQKGLAVRPFSLNIPFKSVLIMPPGRPISRLAQSFLALLRAQLASDQSNINTMLATPAKSTVRNKRR